MENTAETLQDALLRLPKLFLRLTGQRALRRLLLATLKLCQTVPGTRICRPTSSK